METNNIICHNCESEFVIEVVHSEEQIEFCPFCGEFLASDEEEDFE